MNVRGFIRKKNILEKWAEISVAKDNIESSLGAPFAKCAVWNAQKTLAGVGPRALWALDPPN